MKYFIFQEKIVQPVKAPVAARPAAPPAPPVPKQPPTFQQVDVRMELPVPPQFIQPLRNLAAEEGTRVTFEGIVKGKPEPTIKWFKSGKQISDSADFQISFREGRVMLSIPEVFEQDAGKYVCNAANKAGTVDSSAELIVKGKSWFYYFSLCMLHINHTVGSRYNADQYNTKWDITQSDFGPQFVIVWSPRYRSSSDPPAL